MEYFVEILIGGLATYGLTSAIVDSDGPWDIFLKLRNANKNLPFGCFTCTAFWIALPLAFVMFGLSNFLLPAVAMAGVAIFMDRVPS